MIVASLPAPAPHMASLQFAEQINEWVGRSVQSAQPPADAPVATPPQPTNQPLPPAVEAAAAPVPGTADARRQLAQAETVASSNPRRSEMQPFVTGKIGGMQGIQSGGISGNRALKGVAGSGFLPQDVQALLGLRDPLEGIRAVANRVASRSSDRPAARKLLGGDGGSDLAEALRRFPTLYIIDGHLVSKWVTGYS